MPPRPPGGYTPDMMNFAHSTDVYQIWADMVAFDEACKGQGEQYFCAYAAVADDLCDHAYIVRLPRRDNENQT